MATRSDFNWPLWEFVSHLPVINTSFSRLTGFGNDTLDRSVYCGCRLNSGIGQKRLETEQVKHRWPASSTKTHREQIENSDPHAVHLSIVFLLRYKHIRVCCPFFLLGCTCGQITTTEECGPNSIHFLSSSESIAPKH